MKPLTLADLPPGARGIVSSPEGPPRLSERLLALGFSPGSTVDVLYRAPLGDPTAYAVCGTVIALRRGDAEKIFMLSSGKV